MPLNTHATTEVIMKTLKWLAVALIAACLILPGLIGSRIEQTLRSEIANLQTGNLGQLNVQFVDFQGGWFTSRAIIEAKLDPALVAGMTPPKPDPRGNSGATQPQTEPETEEAATEEAASTGQALTAAEAARQRAEEIEFLSSALEIGIDFHHGPFGFDDGIFFGLLSWTYAPTENNPAVNELETELGLPYIFELHGVTSLFRKSNLTLQVPPFKAEEPYGKPLISEFSGLQMHGFYAANDSSFALSGGFAELTLNAPEANLRFAGFETDQQGKLLGASTMFLGEGDFSMSAIEVIGEEIDQNMIIKNVKASSIQDYGSSEEVLDIEAKFSAQEVTVGGNRVENTAIGISLKELSLNGLVQYNQLITSIAESSGSPNPDIAVEALEATLREILTHSPRITFMPIQFSLNGQNLSGGFDIGFNGSGISQVQDLLNRDPTLWLEDIDAQAMLSLDKKLAQQLAFNQVRTQIEASVGDNPNVTAEQIDQIAEAQVPALLDNLAQQGMLKAEGDNYAASLTYIKGELTLNGQDIPLGALLQR